MRKLHLNSALELVLLAVELGLVQRPHLPLQGAPVALGPGATA